MKELSAVEVNEVSGAGLAIDAGLLLGQGIGAIIDAAKKTTTATEAGATLGAGIGAIVEASISHLNDLLSNISNLFRKK